MDTPKLLRVEEVAEILDTSKWKVYELINSGSLPSLKMGKVRRIRHETLQAWIVAQERASSTQVWNREGKAYE